jgi:Tetratricopeptide repeat
VLGEDRLFTLDSLNNLAALYYSQGKTYAAESLYVECLAKRNQVLGEGHENPLLLREQLSALYRSQGKSTKA